MKRFMICLLVLVSATLASESVSASSYTARLDGRPAAFEQGGRTGYYIWQDGEGLHLRTAAPGIKHVFSGTIRTDGTFEDTYGKSAGADDAFRINGDRDRITFQFTNIGDSAGIDLHVQEGTYVTFDLSMDGYEVDPAAIFIGEDGWHPGDHKFTLRHDGAPEKYIADRTVIIVGGPPWWHFSAYWGPRWHGHWHHRPHGHWHHRPHGYWHRR